MDRLPLDPRVAELIPSFDKHARTAAVRRRIEPDDAAQLALLALWYCARRAPEATVDQLRAYAWQRAHGAIIDELRKRNGGRRNAANEGDYGYSPRLVLAARAVGDLPRLAVQLDDDADAGYRIEAIDPHPLPEEQYTEAERHHARALAFRERLARCVPRTRVIVCLVLLGIPQKDVAIFYGITQARVSQILHKFVAGEYPSKVAGRRRRRQQKAASLKP